MVVTQKRRKKKSEAISAKESRVIIKLMNNFQSVHANCMFQARC